MTLLGVFGIIALGLYALVIWDEITKPRDKEESN